MIKLKDISVELNGKLILDSVNLDLPKQKISVLLGSSGCGKSTLLKVIAGLTPIQSGSLEVCSQNISFVFQEPRLLPWLSVQKNIELPLHLASHHQNSPKKIKVEALIEKVGLSHANKLYPHQLSGGMKMRASLARALVNQPDILLLDEPFAALDENIRFSMQDFLLQLQNDLKMTIVFVTHSFTEAVYIGEKIHLLASRGGIVECCKEYEQTEKKKYNRTSENYIQQVNFWSQQLQLQSHRDKNVI